jgi:hypothetical protein
MGVESTAGRSEKEPEARRTSVINLLDRGTNWNEATTPGSSDRKTYEIRGNFTLRSKLFRVHRTVRPVMVDRPANDRFRKARLDGRRRSYHRDENFQTWREAFEVVVIRVKNKNTLKTEQS